MSSVMGLWYEAKLFIEHSTRIEHGTLHVVVGVLAWLALAMLFRRPVSSSEPWLALLVLTIWNELVDLSVERWPHPGMQYGEGTADLILTMLLPTVILLAVRWRPEIFRQPRASMVPVETNAVGIAHSTETDKGGRGGGENDAKADLPKLSTLYQVEDSDGATQPGAGHRRAP